MAANENYIDAVDAVNEINREKHRWEWEREQLENDFDCERIDDYNEQKEREEAWPWPVDDDLGYNDDMDGYTDPWQ